MIKKKLIFFLPEFVRGGAANSIYSLCRNINKKKYQIFIICLRKFYYHKEFQNLAKVYVIDAKKTLFAQKKITEIVLNISNNNRDKTFFISNLFHANVLSGIFQNNNSNIKLVFTDRTSFKELYTYFSFIDFLKKMIIKILIKLIYKKSDLLIANCSKVSKDISKFTGLKTNFVYPGTYKDFTFKGKKKFKDRLNIIWIGRLSKEKGIEDILYSLKGINKKKYKLFILGNGSEKSKIQKFIRFEKLQKNIQILGYKKNVSTFLKKSDLLINTSYFEGFPNVVIEALNYKVPVICSRSGGGIFEILKNGKYGDLYEKGNIDSLQKKILAHINNPIRLYKKAIAGSKDLERFSEKLSAKKYDNIFDKIKF